MTSPRLPSPADVHITRHAIEQLLIRFPEDLLPRHPEAYLRDLLRNAGDSPCWSGKTNALTVRTSRWILVLTHNTHHGTPPWVLVTIKRTSKTETGVPRALRENRLQANEAFRNGQAVSLLQPLIEEIGTQDIRALGQIWYERRYPLVLHGGYNSFEAFYRTVQSFVLPAPARVPAPLARRARYDTAMRTEVTIP